MTMPSNPFDAGLLAWRATLVFTSRSLELWAAPADAPARLAGFAAEKQQAFTAGALAAMRLAGQGATPDRILAAAVEPANRRVRANSRRLGDRAG
jgi:hypothetical protein